MLGGNYPGCSNRCGEVVTLLFLGVVGSTLVARVQCDAGGSNDVHNIDWASDPASRSGLRVEPGAASGSAWGGGSRAECADGAGGERRYAGESARDDGGTDRRYWCSLASIASVDPR